jgi:hypothetical protein
MSQGCKTIRVKNRLGELLRRPGGIRRTEAIESASEAVETLRKDYVSSIPDEIGALEAIAAGSKGKLSARDIDAMLNHAGRLLTLSGTFGYELLDRVVKRFCDFAGDMVEKEIYDVAPVDVHLRAMRLVCPGAAELSEDEAADMLKGLEKVHKHYGIKEPQPDVPKGVAKKPSGR